MLENKKKRTVVVNGNAHILFAPKNGLVKLAQVKEILEAMESAREKDGECSPRSKDLLLE